MRRGMKKTLVASVVILTFARMALGDLRVVTRYSQTGGPSTEHTTYFKGVRQREEFRSLAKDGKANQTAFIFQCDLKRFLWVDYMNRKYFDQPYSSLEEAWAEYYRRQQEAKATGAEAKKYKGLWKETVTVIDTGERREVFGYVARHIKTMTTSEAEPQICEQTRLRQETDGWYIDLLYGTECSSDISGQMNQGYATPPNYNSCSEAYEKRNYKFERKQVGQARFGFPVALTIRAYSRDGRTVMESKREVTEMAALELDQSLFELPDGYTKLEPQPVKRSILDRALSLFR
ncbi:MAG TPA: hypothetical protein VJS44_20325 [Pyrinomonadaceae bacterium]|nr:hypothetical protein [Pyrinomonadaceae bacterium]